MVATASHSPQCSERLLKKYARHVRFDLCHSYIEHLMTRKLNKQWECSSNSLPGEAGGETIPK